MVSSTSPQAAPDVATLQKRFDALLAKLTSPEATKEIRDKCIAALLEVEDQIRKLWDGFSARFYSLLVLDQVKEQQEKKSPDTTPEFLPEIKVTVENLGHGVSLRRLKTSPQTQQHLTANKPSVTQAMQAAAQRIGNTLLPYKESSAPRPAPMVLTPSSLQAGLPGLPAILNTQTIEAYIRENTAALRQAGFREVVELDPDLFVLAHNEYDVSATMSAAAVHCDERRDAQSSAYFQTARMAYAQSAALPAQVPTPEPSPRSGRANDEQMDGPGTR